jgi:hypothetical protein
MTHEIRVVFRVEADSPAHAEAKVRAILHETQMARIEYVLIREPILPLEVLHVVEAAKRLVQSGTHGSTFPRRLEHLRTTVELLRQREAERSWPVYQGKHRG